MLAILKCRLGTAPVDFLCHVGWLFAKMVFATERHPGYPRGRGAGLMLRPPGACEVAEPGGKAVKRIDRTATTLRWVSVLGVCCAMTAAAAAQMITIDNEDPEFSILYGEWKTGAYGQPHGEYYNWAQTSGAGGDPAEAEWRPDLPEAGAYHVSIWYVQGGNRADNATFAVHHASGSTPIVVNQQINGETWYELGTFSFNAGSGGYVTLHNDANPSVVIADAVRFTSETATAELTMEAAPADWGTTDPAPGGPYTYYLNEVVPISAEACSGYEFHHWTVSAGSPVADPSLPRTTVTMDQDKTVTAVFVEEGFVELEFRAFWADAFHVGFKSEGEIDDMIARALIGNYNAIVPEVLAYQDYSDTNSGHGAYWDSDIVPMAHDIPEDFDPLAYMVEQAHANGIEVHPWLVSFRVSTSWPPAGNDILTEHPEWLMVPRDDMGGGAAPVTGKYTLDPGSPDVQEYLMSIVRELVTYYDVDGIHWDYIRYTTTDAGYPADESYPRSGLARFREITSYSGTPDTDYEPWNDFRRREVTEVVRRAQVETATISSNPCQPLRHTAALITWSNAPSDFEDSSAWGVFQNWREWMELGYLDAGIPMTYYDYDVYPSWYRNWVDQQLLWRYERHMIVGPGIYLNSFENSVIEIEYAQTAGVEGTGADGICTYSYASTSGSRDWNWYPYVGSTAFAEPAAPPPMTWRDPNTATEGYVYGRVTDGSTGEPIDDATIEVNGFPVVQTDGNGFYVITQLSAGPGGTVIPLTATDADYPEDAHRPMVLIERAGYTEANFALGIWLPGDYDVDGDVDFEDFTRFEPVLTGPDHGPPPAGGDLFDFDTDNDVDLPDFGLFQESFSD